MTGGGDARPTLAVVCGELPPYRVHFHRRIARELTEMRLATLLYRDSAWSAWTLPPDAGELGVVALGEGELPRMRAGRAAAARSALLCAARTVAWLERHRPAAVLVGGYAGPAPLRAILWAHATGTPCLVNADANVKLDRVTGPKRALKRTLVPWLLRRVDAVLPCGSLGRDFFRRYGVPDDRIFLSPLEPDYDQLDRLPQERIDAVRARFGLSPHRRRFVVSCRLIELKCVDLVIDAFADIAAGRPDWDLVIVGDGPLRAALEAQAAAKDLPGRIAFTGFLGDQADVSAVYRCSDALVLASRFDQWALVINEAAAAGLAIVSTDVVGASAELVRPGVNGHLTPPFDRPAMAHALRDVSDPARTDAMKAASREILADWRRRVDPIDGLRAALRHAGALPGRKDGPPGGR